MGKRSRRGARQELLSRRERQIMDAVYRLGEASVAEIAGQLPDPPTRDAVRRLAHILEEKGHLKHRREGGRNVFFPAVRPERARRSALDHLLRTFFGGSPQRLVAALLDSRRDALSDEEIERLEGLIEHARRSRRRR